jgi:hypothetical protein
MPLPPFPALLPEPAPSAAPTDLTAAPTFTDIFKSVMGTVGDPTDGTPDLIVQLNANTSAFSTEIDAAAPVAAAIPTSGVSIDTSGADALAAAFPAVQATARDLCSQFDTLSMSAGNASVGCASADAGTPAPIPTPTPTPTPVTQPDPGAEPLPTQSNDGTDPGNCGDTVTTGAPSGQGTVSYPVSYKLTLPDLVLGGPDYVFNWPVPAHGGLAPNAFLNNGAVLNGPTDMLDIAEGNVLAGSSTSNTVYSIGVDPVTLEEITVAHTYVTAWFTSYILTVHPIRLGTFHIAASFAVGDAGSSIYILCLTFNVVAAPVAAPSAPVAVPTGGNV